MRTLGPETCVAARSAPPWLRALVQGPPRTSLLAQSQQLAVAPALWVRVGRVREGGEQQAHQVGLDWLQLGLWGSFSFWDSQ